MKGRGWTDKALREYQQLKAQSQQFFGPGSQNTPSSASPSSRHNDRRWSGFWAELTGEPSTGVYSWKRKKPDGAGALTDTDPAVTGTGNAREANGIAGIKTGTIVWLYPNGTNSAGDAQFIFDIAFGKDGTRATIGSTGETEAANTTTWDRDAQASDKFGVTDTRLARMAYSHTGDAKLYAYYRNYEYDANGHLMSISAETRVEIDAPEAC